MSRTGRDSRWLRGMTAVLAGICLAGTVPAGETGAEKPASVRDLHFGDALFYFYQDDYFSAITRMSAARARGQLVHHDEEAELLLGGMHLAYGQHRRAGEIFTRLLDSRSAAVRDRAWFYLARLRYQRGFYDEAEAALARIEKPLDDMLEPLRRQLAVQLLMVRGRYAEAAAALEHAQLRGDWSAFMQFNLGVALIQSGESEQGETVLARVAKRRSRSEELHALRDKARVTRAFAMLQRGAPGAARAALEDVRLEGPFSNKALLGAAWADIEQERYREALVPLDALVRRAPRDAAVQEALLAAPYALVNLEARRQAAEAYEHAIDTFVSESARLDRGIEAIRAGGLIDALVGDEAPRRMGWFWRVDDISPAPESDYLYALMADHGFQEQLKNYRDLLYLRANLARWQESIGAFDDMLSLARDAHSSRLPGIAGQFASFDIASLEARLERLTRTLETARASDDPRDLASDTERARLDRLDELSVAAEKLPGAERQADRIRRLRGVVLWSLQAERSQRLWRLTRSLRDARAALEEAGDRAMRLDAALDNAPQRFAGFAGRIEASRERLTQLGNELERVLAGQSSLLNESAVTVLTARKETLDAFALQARFALAGVYDRAAVAGGAP